VTESQKLEEEWELGLGRQGEGLERMREMESTARGWLLLVKGSRIYHCGIKIRAEGV
jgi:hypothetical protein